MTPVSGGVQVVVTYADWEAADGAVEADGFVPGVVEDGGTCRLTLTSGSATVSVERPAVADAATTSCGALRVPGQGLAPGTWQATLSYRSAASSGRSSPAVVQVPA